MPTFGSLFAGIGGIDLGLERAGWECRFQVEWDPFCQRVLAKHWPDVTRYGDITGVDWSGVERVDLLAGGFPCQPFSVAGKQRRLDDERWLWPEFARAIRELRPSLVLVENVPGLLVGGMDAVLGDLAELGYDAEWESIPAAAVGAPHLRYRVWVVAHANGQGEPGQPVDALTGPGVMVQDTDRSTVEPRCGRRGAPEADQPPLADADSEGSQGRPVQPERPREWATRSRGVGDSDGTSADTHAATGGSRRAASEPSWWSVEPDVGRVAHGVPARVDRLRSLGNAVVPQVVEWIGRRLLKAYEEGVAA